MTAIAFDTLKFVKRLKEAGFSEQQAEALAEAEADLFETTLASKQDIADLKREIETARTELKREIEAVRTELKHEIETVRTELKREIETVRTELKHEIETVHTELKREIEAVRVKLEYEIRAAEQRMAMKLGSLMVVAVGVVATLVKLF
jgi:ketosteroid isomerase-like protein